MTNKLTYASLPIEIKKIANDSLGLGVLKSLFSSANTYHLMIKISDGAFIGFALYHYQNSRTSSNSYSTGIIDCVCVATPYRKAGYGTLLTFGVLRKMSAYGCDRVEMLLKTPGIKDVDSEPGIPLLGSEELLFALGFRKVEIFNKYYEQKSKRYGYDCFFCGDKPDSCKAVLYAIGEDAS